MTEMQELCEKSFIVEIIIIIAIRIIKQQFTSPYKNEVIYIYNMVECLKFMFMLNHAQWNIYSTVV